jgi:ubiquinone/menaquinone biosynthesis C-methylase UbiE
MAETAIRFDDGAAYERMMGTWSRLVGDVFLDWLAPPAGLRWIDVGCGNGAFTEQIVERCAPAEVLGVDPSEGQLAFARTRPASRVAKFQQGNAMALPAGNRTFDAAVMALVIFFVPDPPKGVAEMVRVVRPGGLVAAYAWDMLGGGFPLEDLRSEMTALGAVPPLPPSSEASRIEAMQKLWTDAGVEAVETRAITVRRTFASFDECWNISTSQGSSSNAALLTLGPEKTALLKERLRARLPADPDGRVTYSATANAVKGRLPA